MDKSFGGDLVRVEVPDLLTFVNMGRRTGVLLLERSGQHTNLYFCDGAPIYGNSDKVGLRLSDLLVRAGKLRGDEVQKIVEDHRATGRHMGEILVAAKVLTEDELVSYLKVQTSEVVFDTFRWRAGSFSFYDDVAPPGDAVALDMDLQNLLMEGVRRVEEEGRADKVFPRDWLAVVVSNPEHVKQSVTLTPEEWRVFFLVDGRRSLSEISQIAGDPDERATLEVLRKLVEANLLSVAAPRPLARNQPRTGATAKLGANQARPADSFKVDFAPAKPAPRPEDDRLKIVHPEAVDYAGRAPLPVEARLILVRDDQETSIPLTRDSYAVGRHENNDIVVDNERVSAFHARIDRTPEGFVLVDLRSTNGTFLNSSRVTIGVLQAGDEIRLGPARLRFRQDKAASPPRPAKGRRVR